MIKIIQGDILNSPEDQIIIQQVNCQNKMGKGVAKAIYEKYPFVKEQYHERCDESFNEHNSYAFLLGEAFKAFSSSSDRSVINIFGQFNYRKNPKETGIRYTSYDAFRSGLQKVAHTYKDSDATFAIPFNIGCGLAGGNWNIVYGIIEKELKAFDVYIYQI